MNRAFFVLLTIAVVVVSASCSAAAKIPDQTTQTAVDPTIPPPTSSLATPKPTVLPPPTVAPTIPPWLRAGPVVVLHPDLNQPAVDEGQSVLQRVLSVVRRRLVAYGLSQEQADSTENGTIVVSLAGATDLAVAKQLLSQRGVLEFKQQDTRGNWVPATGELNGQTVALTGSFLIPDRQQVTYATSANLPTVAFEFDSDGARLFQQITRRLIGKPIGIFIDGQEVSAPTVQAELTSGGVITGLSDEQARLVALELNSGALPVPTQLEDR